MATKKGKEKATPKQPARRGTKRALVAEPSSTAVKPSTKKTKRIIKVDDKEKAFPAKDTVRFPNRYCEQMFLILTERSYNNEYLLLLPPNITTFVEPQIARRQWGFLQRQPRQVKNWWWPKIGGGGNWRVKNDYKICIASIVLNQPEIRLSI
ncbi:uncharacterized protein DS421_19g667210 [Arachis hypogaea]|uniref:Uncharacterized protein n=1 Tax=Arachis hypogaea TaxID=3818 RepID=A0A6B9VCJ6_ARAHY|nr:uncharacterized protein DS421_19g667210 [Arachis hypogaea]